MNITRRRVAIASLAGLGIGAGLLLAPADAKHQELAFDISEDMTKFVFDDAPVFDDGMPAAGNGFVTQGYIYPAGTIADGAGVNADGSPTHPDAVLGTWICEGVLIGDGARTETGAWVVSNQVFDFGDLDGVDAITTSGIELSDIDVEVQRAITGGTGEYRSGDGEQIQVLTGFNEGGGVNLTVEFDLDD